MAKLTPDHFLEADIPHRLAVLRGFRNRSGLHSDTFRAAMDGAMVTCRSLWEILGVVRVKPSRGTPKASPLSRAISKLPPNVNVTRFNDQEITILNKGIANKDVNSVEILKVLVGANSCVAHLDDDADHEVTEHVLDRVIDRTIIEIRDRIPNVPWRAFDRPKN